MIKKAEGRLDIVFTKAGIGPLAPLGSINANVKGVFTASVYSATKAAVRSFARCWTVDLQERKIRVNTVSP